MGEAVANAEDLYGLPLTEFTAARDALAKERRAAGDKEAAEGVKSLQKPSLTAWALDQAARAHPEAVARLLERGAGLREAQQEALTGDASRLREAGREVVEEVDRVATQAAEALRAAGREPGAAQLERIRATLRAAAADPGVGELLRRGVLVVDAEPAGFGLGGLEAAPAPTARRRPGRPPGEAGQAVEAARRELRRAQAEADTAAGRARRKVERAEAAERRAQEARNEADAARVEAEEAAGEADAARRRAEEAARRLSEAEE